MGIDHSNPGFFTAFHRPLRDERATAPLSIKVSGKFTNERWRGH